MLHLFFLFLADFFLVVVVDQVDRGLVVREVSQEFSGADLLVVLHVLGHHLMVLPWVVHILVLCHIFALVLSFLAHNEQISLLFAISEADLPPPESEEGHLYELRYGQNFRPFSFERKRSGLCHAVGHSIGVKEDELRDREDEEDHSEDVL